MSITTYGVGRIGKDAVLRHTTNGDAVVGFTLAMDAGWGDKKQTHWFDCSMWGKRGEALVPHLIKGAKVFVSGEQAEREHDGKTYKTLRIVEIELCGAKPSGERAPASQSRTQSRNDEPDDSLPF